MRYLVLAADFLSPQVRDQSGSDDHDPWADLSPELRAALLEWNQQYQVVVPTAIDDRQGIQALIRALDERGVDLASRVADELRPAKVKYYSEGQLTYLVEV